MSDGMLFVLHAPADEKYASALAGELDALTVAQGAANLQFGANVLCIHVLSGWPARAPEFGLVCRLNNAAVPPGLRGIDASGDACADAAVLRPLIGALQKEMAGRASRSRGAAPRMGAAGASAQGKPPLAARSAAGMAMTLAVAGAIGPMIMERAQATATTTPPTPQPPAATAPVAPVQAAAPGDDAAPVEPYIQISAESPTPALDQYLAPAPEAAPVRAAPVRAVHRAAILPVDVPAVDSLPMSDEIASVTEASALEFHGIKHRR